MRLGVYFKTFNERLHTHTFAHLWFINVCQTESDLAKLDIAQKDIYSGRIAEFLMSRRSVILASEMREMTIRGLDQESFALSSLTRYLSKLMLNEAEDVTF